MLATATAAGQTVAADSEPPANEAVLAADQTRSASQRKESIPIVGSRVLSNGSQDAMAPVDVYSDDDVMATGETELGRVLQKLVPSFNFSSTTVSDGTDIIRPATMRGLGPDQVLVLVNGKRRHNQALVNVQQTVGRGSAGTDINAIPVAAIQRIEVLRDGASAQYGSDAIAGVINIVLKDRAYGTEVFQEAGQTYEGDGSRVSGSVNQGFDLAGGFANLTLEYRLREATNRADIDQTQNRRTMRIGDADAKNYYAFANAALPFTQDGELYVRGGFSRREGESGGFYRQPTDSRVMPEFYPDGLLPILGTTVTDRSGTLGFRKEFLPDWHADLSVTSGQSSFAFASLESHNVSLGSQSPTSSENGTLVAGQTTSNLDISGKVELPILNNPLHISFGLEDRVDTYEIKAGDFESYAYGATNDPGVFIADRQPDNVTGGPLAAAPGMQGFPGFQPRNEVAVSRTARAAYIDLENEVFDDYRVAVASRYETHEGVGEAVTGKISNRADVSENLAIRATASTGFRAPSLAQRYYNSTSTTFANGSLTDTLLADQDHEALNQLGVADLKNEVSQSVSGGVVVSARNFSLTIDAYQTVIRDRIVLSGMLQAEDSGNEGACVEQACPIKSVLVPLNVGALQFFSNAIDTRTRGVDLSTSYGTRLGSHKLRFGLLATWNETEVLQVNRVTNEISNDVVFDEGQRVLTEKGQPRQRTTLSLRHQWADFHSGLAVHRFGAVSGAAYGHEVEGTFQRYNQEFGPRYLTDVVVGYRFFENFVGELGANNVFNVYPQELNQDHPVRDFAGGSYKYSWEASPFGHNGGFYFGRVTARL